MLLIGFIVGGIVGMSAMAILSVDKCYTCEGAK